MLPIKRIVSKQLGELLLERGIINETQLDKAIKIQREKGGLIGQILVMLGFAKEEEIAQALSCGASFDPIEQLSLHLQLHSQRGWPVQLRIGT